MSAPMTDEQREAFLRSLRLPTKGKTLAGGAPPAAAVPAPTFLAPPEVEDEEEVLALVEADAPAKAGRHALPVQPDALAEAAAVAKAARKAAKAAVKAQDKAKAKRKAEKAQAKAKKMFLDPAFEERRIPARRIVFDRSMVADYDMSVPEQRRAASGMLFDRFKSPHRDPDRHAVLHDRITDFIQQMRREEVANRGRYSVRANVTESKPQRDLAAFLIERGVTRDVLSDLLDRFES